MPVTPPMYRYEQVGSTMDVMHQLAEQGAQAGTVVLAGEQLAGRGSRGRPWRSPPGGLWMSILFRPPSVGGLEVISLRVGLAVARGLDPLVPSLVRLKWPNDLMLGERKLGGILCEARWQGSVLAWIAVGVGLNLRNTIPPELRGMAMSLVEVQPHIREEAVLEQIVPVLRSLDLRAERLSPTELHQFATRSWLSGREIREPLSGIVAGLADDGTLRVRTAEGAHVSLRNGTIELARVSHTH
jgi:BirA family transcriptional regulator, biotin operon repressor / biotin---[acetyl-CoA-carboxylase] ligase